MQTPDDEQFESYLKQFHPVAPEPVPTLTARASRRSFALGVRVAAVAAILIVGIVVLHSRSKKIAVRNTIRDVASLELRAPSEPLTIRSATTWLAAAPSFKAAVDELAFRSKNVSIPRGKQSAIAVLSKEKTKP